MKNQTNHNEIQNKQRMPNLDLLRCVAMMMVVVLHYLGKGNLLPDLTGRGMGAMGITAWLLESFCIVAVNAYMLISGYFLCTSSFKVSRLLQLWLQIWFYSMAFGLLGALTGALSGTAFDFHYLLTLLFPITMDHYWFLTAYVFLYLLLPFVGTAVKKMTKQQLQIAIGLLLGAFCAAKSILPVRLETDQKGYDCLWYLCVFLTAAYLRRFGVPFLEKKRRGAMLYAGGCLLIFAGTFLLREVNLRTGRMEMLLKVCLEYNHVLVFLAAVGLFAAFCRLRIQGKPAKIISGIAPYTLGVYLLHENLGLRYSWQNWLGAKTLAAGMAESAGDLGAVCGLLLGTGLAAAAVFFCGIVTDMGRKWIFDRLHGILLKIGLYRRLTEKAKRADQMFG